MCKRTIPVVTRMALVCLAAAILCLASSGTGVVALTTGFRDGYVQVDKLNMYYQIHGQGEPLVLLHGGLSTIESSFFAVLPALAESRQVIAVEQQAHGRTADIDRPLTYRQMAEDTVSLLRALGIERADFFGYSSGANVALAIAVHHPQVVHRVALAAGIYTRDGYQPGVLENLAQATPDSFPAIVRESYERVAADPDGWETLVAKAAEHADSFQGWKPEELGSIEAPTLLLIGDRDIVRPEHALEMYRLIPNAQLAILPGTSHNMLVERPQSILSMLTAFFDSPGL